MPKGLGRGYFLPEPSLHLSRPQSALFVFVDGQNLFTRPRRAFGYTYPNYDVLVLATRLQGQGVGALAGEVLHGHPRSDDNPFWHTSGRPSWP